MFYIDARLVLNLDCLLGGHTYQGEGPLDGVYGMHLVLQCGAKVRHLSVDYPSEAARDTAFLALGTRIAAHEAEALGGTVQEEEKG